MPSAAEASQPGLMASMRPKPVEGEARDEEPASPRVSQLLNKVFLLQRCLLGVTRGGPLYKLNISL